MQYFGHKAFPPLETAERLLVRFANPRRLIATSAGGVNQKVTFFFPQSLKVFFLF
jgi:hypothetical protein